LSRPCCGPLTGKLRFGKWRASRGGWLVKLLFLFQKEISFWNARPSRNEPHGSDAARLNPENATVALTRTAAACTSAS
jgi:hypothetical protein